MECKPLDIEDDSLKVPHIGWNSIKKRSNSKLLINIPDNSDFYFVHSYAVQTKEDSIITYTTMYGQEFISSVESNNIFATQFHPEKSQQVGLRLLRNFANVN